MRMPARLTGRYAKRFPTATFGLLLNPRGEMLNQTNRLFSTLIVAGMASAAYAGVMPETIVPSPPPPSHNQPSTGSNVLLMPLDDPSRQDTPGQDTPPRERQYPSDWDLVPTPIHLDLSLSQALEQFFSGESPPLPYVVGVFKIEGFDLESWPEVVVVPNYYFADSGKVELMIMRYDEAEKNALHVHVTSERGSSVCTKTGPTKALLSRHNTHPTIPDAYKYDLRSAMRWLTHPGGYYSGSNRYRWTTHLSETPDGCLTRISFRAEEPQ